MFFFFKQKTAYEMRISDWSSDVCSSDLRIDSRVTRIAVMLDPVSRAAWPGVVGGQRQDVGAAELTQQLLEIRLAEPGVVVGVLGQTVLAERQAHVLRDMARGRGHARHEDECDTGAAGLL